MRGRERKQKKIKYWKAFFSFYIFPSLLALFFEETKRIGASIWPILAAAAAGSKQFQLFLFAFSRLIIIGKQLLFGKFFDGKKSVLDFDPQKRKWERVGE